MSLTDLIATPGEIAAARITRDFDFSSHDAHERLFAAIKDAVDGAAGFSPAPGKTELEAVAAEREACAKIADDIAQQLKDDLDGYPPEAEGAEEAAAAIRARGATP